MLDVFPEISNSDDNVEDYSRFLVKAKKTKPWFSSSNLFEHPHNLSQRQHEILTGLLMKEETQTLINLDPFGYIRKLVVKYLIDGYPEDNDIFAKEIKGVVEELKKAALAINYHKVELTLKNAINKEDKI